jgi:pyruvate,orthophosphate dikinase
MVNWVYGFGGGTADGCADMKNTLGGKGANLAEMVTIGLPVPPGFTITTDVCTSYYKNGKNYPNDLDAEVKAAISKIEAMVGARFGDPLNPLLFSVRSGARVSMPGMMDTVLNLGLNIETVQGLAKLSNNECFAWDSYRRFIQMYSDVVLGVEHYHFEDIIEIYKEKKGVHLDTDLDVDDWQEIAFKFRVKTHEELGHPFPDDPWEQLWGAVTAVFGSWQTDRAKTYRRIHGISESWGTAVNVQVMVFGNMGDTSATGVAFTRNPSTGEDEYYGEYLINAQGEDVVAGIRTPQYLTKLARIEAGSIAPSMEEVMPKVFGQLTDVFDRLEEHYRDMQDIEFTVQSGKLWMLQTRSGKRTAKAALKIAVDLVGEGILSKDEAILRVEPQALEQLLHPTLDPNAKRDIITRALPASPGGASGKIVFTADEAERLCKDGVDVILCRQETSPEDIHGMHAAKGILTSRGGMTSHAAVVARGMGRPCVAGAGEIKMDTVGKTLSCNGYTFKAGDIITLDGSKGEVIVGEVATMKPELSGDFDILMKWADASRRLKVRANAETEKDVKVALEFGSEGIGLCRTEHMFFDVDRIIAVRQMILAENGEGRAKALSKILSMQRSDFAQIFVLMKGLPVTIRLLDPPLHEFMPQNDSDFENLSKAMGVEVSIIKRRSEDLHEFNPMLGHRGCRLGISHPEVYEMQARAIFEGAFEAEEATNEVIMPEIMIPFIATRKELEFVKKKIVTVGEAVFAEKGRVLNYSIGVMIELPRAALQAKEIAHEAEFFSFGTNDLTQTTFGISRDDSTQFLDHYIKANILNGDPFVSIDQEGVGELIKLAVERGKQTRPDIKLGICGEHGGETQSILFCHDIGLDYVSCSPYRVPIARLAAAQAAVREKLEFSQ